MKIMDTSNVRWNWQYPAPQVGDFWYVASDKNAHASLVKVKRLTGHIAVVQYADPDGSLATGEGYLVLERVLFVEPAK